MLLEDGKCEVFKSNARNPFPSNYRPELHVSEALGSEFLSRYLQLVGILHWDFAIGRIDFFHETLLLSQYQANPRVCNFEALRHIFS